MFIKVLLLWVLLIPTDWFTVQLTALDEPMVGEAVIAASDQEVITRISDSDGYAYLTLGAGEWTLTACGKVIQVSTVDGDVGSLLIIDCASIIYLPVIQR